MDNLSDILKELEVDDVVVIPKVGFDAIVSCLTFEQKKEIEKKIGTKYIKSVSVISSNDKTPPLFWSLSKNKGSNLNTDIPDGVYHLCYNYLGAEEILMDAVKIEGGRFRDPVNILALAKYLRDKTGYWGSYLEKLELKNDLKTIDVIIGS